MLQLNADNLHKVSRLPFSEAGLVQFDPDLLIDGKRFFSVAIYTLAPAATDV